MIQTIVAAAGVSLAIVLIGLILAKNLVPKWYAAEVAKAKAASPVVASIDDVINKANGLLVKSGAQQVSVTTGGHTVGIVATPPRTLADPPLIPAARVAIPYGAADMSKVIPIPLDPKSAATMSQTAVQNLGFVAWLNTLTDDALAQWQSDFVQAAHAIAATSTNAGQLLYDPISKQTVACSGDAQSVLVQLIHLGTTRLIASAQPGQ
jgi:hypothetical protein